MDCKEWRDNVTSTTRQSINIQQTDPFNHLESIFYVSTQDECKK